MASGKLGSPGPARCHPPGRRSSGSAFPARAPAACCLPALGGCALGACRPQPLGREGARAPGCWARTAWALREAVSQVALDRGLTFGCECCLSW